MRYGRFFALHVADRIEVDEKADQGHDEEHDDGQVIDHDAEVDAKHARARAFNGIRRCSGNRDPRISRSVSGGLKREPLLRDNATGVADQIDEEHLGSNHAGDEHGERWQPIALTTAGWNLLTEEDLHDERRQWEQQNDQRLNAEIMFFRGHRYSLSLLS